MAIPKLEFVRAPEKAVRAFAAVREDMLTVSVFGAGESAQYLVEIPGQDRILQTRSFDTKVKADAFCNEHSEARYLGIQPLKTLLVV